MLKRGDNFEISDLNQMRKGFKSQYISKQMVDHDDTQILLEDKKQEVLIEKNKNIAEG